MTRGDDKIDPREIGHLVLFNPQAGQAVYAPSKKGGGNWVGAPSVAYDPAEENFYLYRRIRQPRPIRGGECRIAVSKDGYKFKDIWQLRKEDLGTPSLERAALVRGFDGDWLLYISYVDPSDNRWRIDVLRASSPDAFDPSTRKPVLTAEILGVQGVKDPVVYKLGGEYFLFYCYAHVPTDIDKNLYSRMHEHADAFNTDLVFTHTALAVSKDGEHFTTLSDVLIPSEHGWDSNTTRTTSILYNGTYFIMFYDGKANVTENYEEKCGYAISFDFLHWHKVTNIAPALTSPWGSGSLRYVDLIKIDKKVYFYYEISQADASHELHLNIVKI